MAALAVLKALLGELGQRIGMADLRPDDNGITALAVDGRFVLHIAADEDNGAVVLYALLGAVRADEQLSVWRRLLEYNPGAADGSSLGLDAATGQVILVRRHSLAALDYVGFERIVEGFMATAEGWNRELAAGPAAATSKPPDEPFQRWSMQDFRA